MDVSPIPVPLSQLNSVNSPGNMLTGNLPNHALGDLSPGRELGWSHAGFKTEENCLSGKSVFCDYFPAQMPYRRDRLAFCVWRYKFRIREG